MGSGASVCIGISLDGLRLCEAGSARMRSTGLPEQTLSGASRYLFSATQQRAQGALAGSVHGYWSAEVPERLTLRVTALYAANAAPSRLCVSAHAGDDHMTRGPLARAAERDID